MPSGRWEPRSSSSSTPSPESRARARPPPPPPRPTAPPPAAEAEFERLEAVMSRFRPESELSSLNREGSLEASPDLLRVVELALEARERTGGRFDPTVHDAVLAAGYDRTFEELAEDAPSSPPATPCGGAVEV